MLFNQFRLRKVMGVVFLGLAGLFLSTPSTVQAQKQTAVQVQQFRPWADPSGMFQTQSAENLGHLQFLAGLYLNYAKDPLALRDAKTGDRLADGSILSHQIGADLVLGIGFIDYLELAVQIPLSLYQVGKIPNQQGLFTDPAPGTDISGFALSDIKIHIKSGFLKEKDMGINLGIQLYVGIPAGDTDKFNGAGGLTFGAALLFSKHIGSLNIAFNFGYRYQPSTKVVELLVIEQELFYGLGLSLALVEDSFDLIFDVAGATGFTGGSIGGLRAAPLEGYIGARIYPGSNTDLALNVGVGLPFFPGYGTPQIRAFFGVTYSPRDHDKDNDGIVDDEDKCPEKPGPRDNGGCPWGDTDGDGLKDNVDKCPKRPGPKENSGCPDGDRDNDGIVDRADKCPDVPGVKEQNGCPWPDTDGDGLKDNEDKCPKEKGPSENRGCPWGDTDGDGLKDNEDRCPRVKGPKENRGCPDTDRDNDGIVDRLDKCPDVPGIKGRGGCPKVVLVQKTKTGIKILKKIYFRTNRARIKPVSFAVLDQVAAVLKSNPKISVEIQGHTDSRGSASKNKKLSDRRAKSVRKYLIKKGVDGGRLNGVGYGEEKAIDSNKTRDGRANNRRVEFKITGGQGVSGTTE